VYEAPSRFQALRCKQVLSQQCTAMDGMQHARLPRHPSCFRLSPHNSPYTARFQSLHHCNHRHSQLLLIVRYLTRCVKLFVIDLDLANAISPQGLGRKSKNPEEPARQSRRPLGAFASPPSPSHQRSFCRGCSLAPGARSPWQDYPRPLDGSTRQKSCIVCENHLLRLG